MRTHLFLGLAALSAAGCAAAPPPASPLRDDIATAGIGGHARLVGVDVAPVRIEEDSRCPTGVQCVQAGTVRLLVRIEDRRGQREAVLSLGKPLALEAGGWIALAAVCPYPSTPQPIARADYRFTFAFRVQPPPDRLELPCA